METRLSAFWAAASCALLLLLPPAAGHHDWAVCVPKGRQVADQLAAAQGLTNAGEIIPDSHCYHFVHQHRAKRSLSDPASTAPDAAIAKVLSESPDVESAEEQIDHVRVKRGLVRSGYHGGDDDDDGAPPAPLNDPFWSKMWYLNRPNGLNMNVAGAWRDGWSGKGVAVTILDDGVEKDHPDLIRNYDPLSSTDINDNDSDPNPRYDFSDSNRHGTRCAGQVAASPNNSQCAVGLAFNAQIGGIRMLDGQVSDAVEARSLSFNPDHVDIYSSSWGPNDDGKTVDGPGKLAYRAFKNGITRGRDGKGSIFVWASGNGGRFKDNCNCDGYATSIYTITVSSTSESGQIPWYSEACSSTLATTYSSGTTSERQIVTTDLHHGCTVKHTGTSASAPMASAIIALALEANPDLTWRDVQHIIVRTSRPLNLKAPDWRENGLGRKVSHSYGYGLMDATAMVAAARRWQNVPKQRQCTVNSPYYGRAVPAMGYVTVELEVTEEDCPMIEKMEQVVAPIHVSVGRKRGDMRIYLQSPSGTRSTLLDARPQDYSGSGFNDWPFMSVHHWGENPRGVWTLEIHNDAYSKWASEGKLYRWSLELYGIEQNPNDAPAPRVTVVREANEPKPRSAVEATTTTTTTTSTTTTTTPQLDRGCVSKMSQCTKVVAECRTFSYRRVASILCRCTSGCVEVAASGQDEDGRQTYNLQCDVNEGGAKSQLPFYCQFIPF